MNEILTFLAGYKTHIVAFSYIFAIAVVQLLYGLGTINQQQYSSWVTFITAIGAGLGVSTMRAAMATESKKVVETQEAVINATESNSNRLESLNKTMKDSQR